MGTVLCANRLADGVVIGDPRGKRALHKHLDRLDRLADEAGLPPLSALCDTTDLRATLQGLPLPAGMTSIDQWMAVEGMWLPAGEAAAHLDALLRLLERERPRFGLFRNDYALVVRELREALDFAREGEARNESFNFSVVM